jgi:DNA-directed RNA polymerase specialized sigma24 family protein
MLSTPPELSPDLEWMLQSGQAKEEMLAEALIEEYYAPVFRLALAVLDEPERARQAALETFGSALLEAHRYDGKSGVRAWLLRLALNTCQTYRGTKPTLKSELNPSLERGLPDSEILRSTLQRLGVQYTKIDTLLNDWTQMRREDSELSPTERRAVVDETVRDAHWREARQRRFTYLKELVLASVAIALVGVIMWGSNRLTAEVTPLPPSNSTPTPTATSIEQGGQIASNPTPIIAAVLAEPLNLSSSPEEVEIRILNANQFWHTLWADFDLVMYGPPGYVGPPHAVRAQVWLSQPNQTLLLTGPVESNPDYHFNGNDQGFFQATMDNLLRWYYLSFDPHTVLGAGIEDLTIPFSDLKNGAVKLQILGLDSIAGREALVVDQINSRVETEARLWVDVQTGVILRKRLFAKMDMDTVVLDAFATRISYDVDFPPETFASGGASKFKRFAQDATGEPDTGEAKQPKNQIFAATEWAPPANRRPFRSYHPPPPGFDPSNNHLTFQFWHYFTSWEPKVNGASKLADLFSNEYYLGSLGISDPFAVICERSPNGARLALAQRGKNPGREQSLLTWMDLSDAKNVNTLRLDLDLSTFAFAPDNRRLAIFGTGKPLGSLSILNTDTGKLTKLLNLAYVHSLMWSPDGEFLALIGNWETAEYDEEFMVIRTSTGEVTYLSRYNNHEQEIAANWPAMDWGKTFPERMGGLAACAEPPPQQMASNENFGASTNHPDPPLSR